MILEKIIAATKRRVEAAKGKTPLALVQETALDLPLTNPFIFEKALATPGFSFICEIKKASPSKGIIATDFPYRQIALDYEAAGATAISVLTEPDFFLGSDHYLTEIKSAVDLPLLRKDFILDEYQIYESKCIGAGAILLICSLLSPEQLARYIDIAATLGLSALVEAHTAQEIAMALAAKARIIGVNNRNLADFSVDMQRSITLRRLVSDQIIFVAESGIKTAEDIQLLQKNNIHAALIGETLMRCADKAAALAELSGQKSTAKIKICGISRLEDIVVINETKPDYIGFVFAKSPRKVSAIQAKKLKQALHPSIKTIGVFVNEPNETILALCRENILDLIQLHGEESAADIEFLQKQTGKPVIKAIRVKTAKDIAAAQNSPADYLLFDTYSPDALGGTGKTFGWSQLIGNKKPFFLAGGIGPQNARAAIAQTAPYAIDISSGVESGGQKDPQKIKNIIDLVRR